jgi:hypothetical protein
MDLHSLIAEYQDEKKMHCHEGSRGVENLCRLVNTMGYQDAMHRGQFAQDGCHGDLIEFLSDNPGAIEAIINWIGDQDQEEWKENILSELPERAECDECGGPLEPFMKENGHNLEEVFGCPNCDS